MGLFKKIRRHMLLDAQRADAAKNLRKPTKRRTARMGRRSKKLRKYL